MPNPHLSEIDPEGLESYFTSLAQLRKTFKDYVLANACR